MRGLAPIWLKDPKHARETVEAHIQAALDNNLITFPQADKLRNDLARTYERAVEEIAAKEDNHGWED